MTIELLLKIVLGIAQPQRQIRGAKQLARAAVDPATVCGSWRLVRRDRRSFIQLELDYVPGPSALEALREGTLSEVERRRAATAVGRIVAKLAVAGLFHRDLTLTNLIVKETSEPAQICVVDTVGVRRIRRPVPEIARMLERLVVQPDFNRIPVPRMVWMPLLLAAMRPLAPATRQAVFRTLKQHRRR